MSTHESSGETTAEEREAGEGRESEREESESPGKRLVGRGIRRREDADQLRGLTEYVDDLSAPGMVHLTFVRSEVAHADVLGIDTVAAAEMDGVLAVFTWNDIEVSDAPGVLAITDALDCDVPGHPVLARDRVRYQGQPVAAVVAEDRYRARDGADAVEVVYDERDTVVDPRAATEADAPTLFADASDNVAVTSELGDSDATDEAFAAADHVVELDLENNRLIPNALEPRAALARYDPGDGRFTVELTSQSPHGHRRKLSHTLGVSEGKIRVRVPDVGGGFGHKGHHHPGEAMAAWSAREFGRPVKWVATRSENYRAGAHGRDHRTRAELAVDSDGAIRGLRARTHASVGGYGLGGAPVMSGWYGRLLSSQYDIPALRCETHAVFTTTAPVHSYRGAGRPEAIYVTERLVATAARELELDPAEFRRRNLIDPGAFPYETPVGAEYDSGDYEPALDAALDAVGYADIRENGDQADEDGQPREDAPQSRQDGPQPREDGPQPRDDDRLVGVGLGCYVESTGGGHESGGVRVHPDGSVSVSAGTHSHGQGHGTTYAQIVADELGVPYDDISVAEGDTDQIPQGTGTFGSRSTIVGGNAVAESARTVREKAIRIAAVELEADPDSVEYTDCTFEGPDGETVSFETVAETAYGRSLPADLDPGLDATTFYEVSGAAYSFGVHAAVVAVDPETGEFDVERYVAVDDCGERINPTIVEGQVHGGVAQGIGQARYEHAVYDDEGALVTDSLRSYAVPRADQIPEMETHETVTPSPLNDLGVKGIGEAGTIAAPPTIVNAVVDALSGFDVDHLDMPLTEDRVWRAIHGE